MLQVIAQEKLKKEQTAIPSSVIPIEENLSSPNAREKVIAIDDSSDGKLEKTVNLLDDVLL